MYANIGMNTQYTHLTQAVYSLHIYHIGKPWLEEDLYVHNKTSEQV